jgi:transposase
MDVHKKTVTVGLVYRDRCGGRVHELRTFQTMTRDLLEMRDWLQAKGCNVVALESTGVSWKPIVHLVEGAFEVLLVNPTHSKHVPGRKTDAKDCEWMAEGLEHGLLRGRFLPPGEIRDLRDLTRYRRQLVKTRREEVNRRQNVLEDANIKLASGATDVMGKSGRTILEALLGGEREPQVLAELARGRLRTKKAELEAALQGLLRPHHALLLAEILAHIDSLEDGMACWEERIDDMCRPVLPEIELLDTIPGVEKRAAQDVVAEIGGAMSRFPSHKHLSSWAKLSPGNNESAGKRYSGKTGKGDRWLRSLVVECAHAAGHAKGTSLGAQYHRLAGRKGKKRAAVAVGHSILDSADCILRDTVPYKELGADHFDTINRHHVIRYHVRRLESLGLKVQIEDPPLAA